MNTKQQFEKYRKALLDECQSLMCWVHISKTLKTSENREAKQIAPCFFFLTQRSLFMSIVVQANKLFNPREKRNIRSFLNFVKSNRKELYPIPIQSPFGDEEWTITLSDIEQDQIAVEEFESITSRLSDMRDKYFAHFDKKHFFDQSELWNKSLVSFDALDHLLHFASDLLTRYSIAYDGEGISLQFTNINDVENLLRFIKNSRDKRLKKSCSPC